MRRKLVSTLSIVALVLVDQLFKILAVRSLGPNGSVTLIPDVFSLTYVENYGAAFGSFWEQRWFLVGVTGLLVLGGIVFIWMNRIRHPFALGCATMILAGGAGNLLDRTFRGYVVDFFDFAFMDWYVFNVADIYVVLGVIWLMFLMLFVIKDEPAADPHAEPDGEKKKGD